MVQSTHGAPPLSQAPFEWTFQLPRFWGLGRLMQDPSHQDIIISDQQELSAVLSCFFLFLFHPLPRTSTSSENRCTPSISTRTFLVRSPLRTAPVGRRVGFGSRHGRPRGVPVGTSTCDGRNARRAGSQTLHGCLELDPMKPAKCW